jgi:hypothetical protein
MGAKCTKQKPGKVKTPYPKFTYFSTEAAMTVKFNGPQQLRAQQLALPPEHKLPADALTCKVAQKFYFIVGGINMYTWGQCADCYAVRFDRFSITKRADCLYAPYGGTLYLYETQIYLVGSGFNANPQLEADLEVEKIPPPFNMTGKQAWIMKKYLRPGAILRYSIPRNRWKEVMLSSELLESDEIVLATTPDKLFFPGTCQIDSKILFFSGLFENEEGELAKNEHIYTFDILTRKIGLMKVRFEFGPFTELKCAKVSKKRILILGGYNDQFEYNRKIFRYTVDLGLKIKKELLAEGVRLTDNNPPVGKYKFAVFFGYPTVFLTRFGTERREYLKINTTLSSALPAQLFIDNAEP